MMRFFGLGLASVVLAAGCSGAAGSAPASITPEASLDRTLELAPNPRSVHLPEPGPCEPTPAADGRCPAEILHAAALSWLGKTTAEYDGVELVVHEYDDAELQAEARADAAFAELLLSADVAPCDGRLDQAESAALEARVLALVGDEVAS